MRSKRKRKENDGVFLRRGARGSVFVLAQVSLFIKFVILWRCKAFLQVRQQNGVEVNDGRVVNCSFSADDGRKDTSVA